MFSAKYAGAYLTRSLSVALHAALLGFVLVSVDRASLASVVAFEGVSFDLRVTPLGNVGVTPLKALLLTVAGKDGSIPSIFDSTNVGFPGPYPGITTAGNALHQVWEFDGALMTPSLFFKDDAEPIPVHLDSHLLVNEGPNGNVNPFELPYEDMVPGSIEDPRGGFGSFLQATVILRPGFESPNWELAYLVVPAGTELRFDFTVAGTPGEDRMVGSYAVLLGDMDFNGRVDFDDISPFVLGLKDPAAYVDQYALAPVVSGDLDQDGDVDFDDIPGLLSALASPQGGAAGTLVPEPATLGLFLMAVLLFGGAIHHRRSGVGPW